MPTKKTPASSEEQLAAVREALPEADLISVAGGIAVRVDHKTRASDIAPNEAAKPKSVRRKKAVVDTSLNTSTPDTVGLLSPRDWDKLRGLGGVATTQTSWEDKCLEAARTNFGNLSAYRELVRRVYFEQVYHKPRPKDGLVA